MKLHRFYVQNIHTKAGHLELDQQIWIHDQALLNQWLRVLRFKVGNELVLFNNTEERLYKISKIEPPASVFLEMITEIERKLPTKHVYLMWSLLKKDKNEWVLQKATELGVKDFVPIIADRSEKTGLNLERAKNIVIEAAEQCGRSDLPVIREAINLETALEEYKDLPLFICEQAEGAKTLINVDELGVLIGPEGGWSDKEKALFKKKNLKHINLSDLTLRAETAAITALSIVFKS